MMIEEALAIIDALISPKRLNSVQEMIFRECWEGKTYQEIAQNSNYDTNYLRGVGSRLWQFLSEVCEEKVTKNNIKSILRQRSTQKLDREPNFLTSLELPKGSVPINSDFYIERSPIESNCYYEISQPGAFLQIKAPKNMGKTSLIDRILAAKNAEYHTLKLNLEQADREIQSDLQKLLRWLGANICSRLKKQNLLDDYWQQDLGVKVSFTNYLKADILEQLDRPFILALDRLEVIFKHREVAQDFLNLLSFWHEEAKNSSVWQKLRLIVAQSTTSYIALNFNESSLNMGIPIKLPEFNSQQVLDLATKYKLTENNNFNETDLQTLRALIGGHPYLTRLAFYNLVKHDLTLSKLIAEAGTESSIYIEKLRYDLKTLSKNPELAKAFKKVVLSESPVQIESIVASELESLGLILIQGNEVIPSCELYRIYFQERLDRF